MSEDPTTAQTTDRLSSTLFVAALVHGIVILGVTFTAGPLGEIDAIPSLRVTLLTETTQLLDAHEDADYLAQRNQRGGGERPPGDRPTTTLSAGDPLTQVGEPLGTDLTGGRPQQIVPSTEQLVTRNLSDRRYEGLPEPTEAPAEAKQTAATLIEQRSAQTLAAEVDLMAALPSSNDRELLASPNTRESSLATYLDGWRRRVEQIGTVNFPAQARGRRPSTNPTLEVAINADGRLDEIIVRRSSGDTTLDQAAVSILRMAAPFDPLPAAIRAEYDVLRFAYEWDFDGGQ